MEALFVTLAFLFALPIEQPSTSLSQATHYLIDQEESLATPEAALEAFAQNPSQLRKRTDLSLGLVKHPVWFVSKLINKTQDENFVLSFDFYNLDYIDVWLLTDKGLQSFPAQGDHNPISQRMYFSRTANIAMSLPREQEVTLIYRIKTQSTLIAGTSLFSLKAFVKEQAYDNALYWCVYGIIIGISAFYAIIGAMTGKRMIRLYLAYLFAIFGTQFTISGHAFIYLPNPSSESTNWMQVVMPVSLMLMARFASRFLRLRYFQPLAFRVLQAAQVCSLAICPLVFFGMMREATLITQVNALVLPACLVFIALRAARLGQKEARFFLLSFGIYFLSMILFVAKNLSLIPAHYVFTVALPLSCALQVALMGLALADRLRQIESEAEESRRQKEQQQEEHHHEILAANQLLEHKVKEKTKDLRILLEHTDIGIFSINESNQIEREYSRQLEVILDHTEIEGKTFDELFLRPSRLSHDEQAKVSLALQYAIGASLPIYQANAYLLPRTLKHMAVPIDKHLELDWTPILNERQEVERILVSVRDVTEVLDIRRRAHESELRYRLIAELLDLGPDRYREFRNSVQIGLKKMAQYQRKSARESTPSKDIQDAIYRELHTSKALGRAFHLQDLTEAFHEAEHIVATEVPMTSADWLRLGNALDHIQELADRYDADAQKLFPGHNVQVQDPVPDTGHASLHTLVSNVRSQVQDAARSTQKPMPHLLNDIPESVCVPTAFYQALVRVLPLMISNALDHGIEEAAVRLEKGKPDVGSLWFFVDAQGRLAIRDDGQGLSLRSLEQKALAMGLTDLTQSQLVELLFERGFSTKAEVSLHSGRGIGLNAVRALLREQGSDIHGVGIEERDGFLAFYFAIDLPFAADDDLTEQQTA